jgi:hypothetical protein
MKIEVFKNGRYLYTTTARKTCREALRVYLGLNADPKSNKVTHNGAVYLASIVKDR